MDGSGTRKKRKTGIAQLEEYEEELEEKEENEEEKMEKFFALIRSTRDVRERFNLMGNNEGRLKELGEKKKLGNENKLIGVWNPTFQPEDFMEDHEKLRIRIPSSTNKAGPSKTPEEDGRKEEGRPDDIGGDALDLNLSL